MRTTIIIVCILALAATIGTIIVGTGNFEGIVVEKPYEAGLAWDEMNKRKTQLGWTVNLGKTPLRTGRNELQVAVFDGNNTLLADADVIVTLSRPSTRAYDKQYQTVRQADGSYQTSVDIPLYGNWDVLIDVVRNKDRAGFKIAIFADKGSR
jgi:nitrogen fixation protein FixH